MTMEEFYLYQEQIFDSFSKHTIKNLSSTIHSKLDKRAEQETALSALPLAEASKLSSMDTYHLDDGMTFMVRGCPVIVQDSALGQALFSLPPKRRDVILLFYFLDKNDPQIGQILNLSTGTVNYRRATALSRLRELLEELGYEA